MGRLTTLLLSNNYIARIGSIIGEQLSSVTAVILTNNRIKHFDDLKNLATLTKLEYVSLLENPIAARPHYRAYLIFKCPHLKLLDFQKVTLKERQQATKLFTSDSGKSLLNTLESDSNAGLEASKQLVLTEDQKQQVRNAIEKVTTREEIDLIELQLKVIHQSY